MKKYQKETIAYYNKFYQEYEEDKHQVSDFDKIYQPFLEKLPKSAHILDFGCGTGRDSKYFKEHGYIVTALDGSEEMCKLAAKNTQLKIIHQDFFSFAEDEKYDGIWACASLLHLTSKDLVTVLKKLEQALKSNGYLYLTFKLGDYEGQRNGRFFNDMTEEKLRRLMPDNLNLTLETVYLNDTTLTKQKNKTWINFILRKKNFYNVLSIKEPFATLIKEQIKFIETRSWKTNYRGTIYIHASLTRSDLNNKNADFKNLIKELSFNESYILCKCKLVDCIYMTEEYIEEMRTNNYQEYICGRYEVGRYAFVLEDIVPLEKPILAKGKLGIWQYNLEAETSNDQSITRFILS